MTKFKRLRKEAKASATFRGHDMERYDIKGTHKAYSECKVCGACIVVLPRPFPNEINISGEAVAVGCKDMDQS